MCMIFGSGRQELNLIISLSSWHNMVGSLDQGLTPLNLPQLFIQCINSTLPIPVTLF